MFYSNWQWKRPLVRIPLMVDVVVCALLQSAPTGTPEYASLRSLQYTDANAIHFITESHWIPTKIFYTTSMKNGTNKK
ncbi:hypothetical protein T07_3056 [Trichinella nelsoni]|uniref:Secreted protein n=1 Tax=Trichinella nelsoni TaxID=6336 RepID=A0A0V0S7F7_9BILA|nr:hypothetical protein T07_3056 [Trichinella nelsoni]